MSHQRRGVALLIVSTLFAAQPVVMGLHHLLQPHFWCLEHRSFEHRLDNGTAERLPSEPNALAKAPGFNPVEDEHRLCPISQQVNPYGRLPSAIQEPFQACCARADDPISRVVHASVPLLSYAPKLSPPSFAVSMDS